MCEHITLGKKVKSFSKKVKCERKTLCCRNELENECIVRGSLEEKRVSSQDDI